MTTLDAPVAHVGSDALSPQLRALAARLVGAAPTDMTDVVRSLRAQAPVPAARAFRCRLEPQLWRDIGALASGQTRATALALVDLARAMLALDPHARERTRTYSRRWRIQSSEDLRAMLARIDSVAEAAIYLASFKPRGLIVTLPFGLAAEILLRAHGERPRDDGALLDWLENGS
ncbi:hypothetical protein [Achromobacter sp. AONIH1]|uniref:hypothetical protein n=1 Tax=Achromobacter sp. AONIH1 TaxID=1758194 RepID=UPI000CCFE776|nr:hypothetical protein [Achromobacter sp. AONIH1]AUT48093.1 hypothetical protein C2U31_20075 [Achromobacter sp. AONIH1]